nr:hypothetical protein [uncultured Desulfobacter sp.]
MKENKVEIGSVHGRFQLFHNDHLRYVLAAIERCDFLIVGVTSFVNTELTLMEKARHRALPRNNPFTYYERTQVIREALVDSGVSSSHFSFSPFPIEQPELLPQFVPLDVKCYTTVYDEWNRQKVKTLLDTGYDVEVMWESDNKEIAGSELREKILNGDESWKKFVPEASVKAVAALGIRHRIL